MRAFPYADKDQQVFFIAEIGSNHNNDWLRLKQLIFEAKKAGCDAVKLQYYDPETLWAPEFPERREAARKGKTQFGILREAFTYCKKNKISLGCSVFDLDTVFDVSKFVDFLKIASYECMWKELITACNRHDKPLFISTGMCDVMEIYNITKMMWPTKEDSIFHCMSMYPADIKDVRIDIVELIAKTYKRDGAFKHIGYSDHTTKPSVIYSALAFGASIFECHVDLDDKLGTETKHGHCWNFGKLKRVIDTCKEMKEIWPIPENTLIDNFMDRADRKDIGLRVDPTDGMRPTKEFRK